MGQSVPVPGWAKETGLEEADYRALVAAATDTPDAFWLAEARRLDWARFPTLADESSFAEADFQVRWFADGRLNVAANCLDRHLATRGAQTAIVWEPDDPAETPRHISYRELHADVCRFANVLRAKGVGKGDRVTLYLPMIPEAAVAMLACARIGAVHSVVFGGFLARGAGRADRAIATSGSSSPPTRGAAAARRVPLKANVDAAREARARRSRACSSCARTGADGRDGRAGRAGITSSPATAPADCPPEPMDAEDPLFILYTSGSTGKPKGVRPHQRRLSAVGQR